MKDNSNKGAGKGPLPRPVKGDVYRDNYQDIFRGGEREKKIKEKKKKEERVKKGKLLCPHCATINFVIKEGYVRTGECMKCGYAN